MAVSHVNAIESVLQHMRAVSHLAQGALAPAMSSASVPQAEGGFAAVLRANLRDLANRQNAASTQAKAFVAGEPGIALNDVMLDLQKANVAFQTTVQVRNRLVAAYQEIANLAV